MKVPVAAIFLVIFPIGVEPDNRAPPEHQLAYLAASIHEFRSGVADNFRTAPAHMTFSIKIPAVFAHLR